MARFRAVQRGVHVGVYDTVDNEILDLTTDVDQKIATIQIVAPQGDWSFDDSYTQSGTDKDVAERWNDIVAFWNGYVDNKQQIPYHISGDGQRGLNCENIVSYVLEGRVASKLGKIAGWLHDNLGVDFTRLKSS